MRRGEYEEIEKQIIYAGVGVRETEEGAEDRKGEERNKTGTITGKGRVTEVWKRKGWVVDG